MKRALAALAGILGIAWWRRRKHEPPAQAPPADPAEELRAKLAASREPEPEAEPETPADVADRRQDVHARARAAIDELTPGE